MMTDSKPTNLGRGLSALLGEPVGAAPSEESERTPKSLPVEFLHPGKYQPRRHMDEERIRELAQSISEQGVLQPLLVRRHPDEPNGFEIIAGERRWRAAQLARLHEVPVIIKDLSDPEALEIALVENLQRQDLSPLEEAEGYQRLMDEFGHTQEVLASGVGKSRSHVANMLRLLNLPGPVKAMLDSGEISSGHARALLNAPDPSEVARRVVNENLNVRQTERLVRKVVRQGGLKKTAPAIDPDTKNLERDLTEKLGLHVAIRPKQGSGGAVIIKYTDLEQLDGIVDRLSGKAPPVDMEPEKQVPTASQDEGISKTASAPAKKQPSAKSPKPKSKTSGDQSAAMTKKTSTSSAASGSSRSTSSSAPSKSKQQAKDPEPDPDPGTAATTTDPVDHAAPVTLKKKKRKPKPEKNKLQSSPTPKPAAKKPVAPKKHKPRKTKPAKISLKASSDSPLDKPKTETKTQRTTAQNTTPKPPKEKPKSVPKQRPPKAKKKAAEHPTPTAAKPKPKISAKTSTELDNNARPGETASKYGSDMDDIFAVVEKVYGASAQGRPLPEPDDTKSADPQSQNTKPQNQSITRQKSKQTERPSQTMPNEPTLPKTTPSKPKAARDNKKPTPPTINPTAKTRAKPLPPEHPKETTGSDPQAPSARKNSSPIPIPPNRATPEQQKERERHKARMAKGLPPKLTVNLKPAENQQ